MPKDNDISFLVNRSRFQRRAAKLLAQGNVQMVRGIDQSTKTLRNLIKKDILNRKGAGRLYRSKRGTTSGMHRASAPGEPPAPDTNTYRQSWTHDLLGGGLRGVVFTTDDRGPMLEFGTIHMDPRPHALKASKAHKRPHVRILRRALRKAIKLSGL